MKITCVCVCVFVCYIHISQKFLQNVSNMELANTLNSLAALYWNQSEYYRAEVAFTFSLPNVYIHTPTYMFFGVKMPTLKATILKLLFLA